ncbi:MAG: MoxR-like ATPase [uncultured archaeon A07HR60]|nr:MAG: MoxR-like ATPase [uncultured archaeon A07HR60]
MMEADTAAESGRAVLTEVGSAVITSEQFLETVMAGAIAGGHVLMEDVPGTGKTLTANSFADALGVSFRRVQFTPDLLPSDITGSTIYNESTGEFSFQKGPIFANVVLADEINRAPPKTQAALLEAMGEKQVTVGSDTYDLPDPFFVIATQNPVEQEGTFRLPEAQRDRFMFKTSMGYPDRAGEREILDMRADRNSSTPAASAVLNHDKLNQLRETIEEIEVEPRLRDYIVSLARKTRDKRAVDVGVSPRGIQRAFEATRAIALLNGRTYVVPDDIKRIAEPVFNHRLVLTTEARVENVDPSSIITDILEDVTVPPVN